MSMSKVNIHDQVKSMIIYHGWTLTRVVKEMNLRHPGRKETTVQNISNKMTRGTIKYAEVLEIADIIGCNIEWRYADDHEENSSLNHISNQEIPDLTKRR